MSESELPRGKSPVKKKQKVSDSSMEIPKPSGAKQQATIDSYGKHGKNHGKYHKKKNPRNSVPENETPIEANILLTLFNGSPGLIFFLLGIVLGLVDGFII